MRTIKKAIYAVDANGSYTIVASSGWEVEETVTRLALRELERLAEEARSLVQAGEYSPPVLPYVQPAHGSGDSCWQ